MTDRPEDDPTFDELLDQIEDCLDLVHANSVSAVRLSIVANRLQPLVGHLLRSCVDSARSNDISWVRIGDLTATSYTTLYRQHTAEGPMLASASRTTHKKDLK